MKIKILSNTTINKIAAGEVIERPASVVKELVENAIDSGATQIDVTLQCAGKNLIIVKDNGCGLSKEEMELAVQRHATSKLDEDDLLNINSFGFRGEALPSIAAISKFTISSRKKGDEKAFSLSIIGGKQDKVIESNLQEGTKIEVRDLFFATPARLKFLRSDKTELNACVLLFKKMALSHPGAAFSLAHNNKTILKVRAGNSEGRIKDILGQEFVENAATVNLDRDGFSISGFTSLPTYNRASAEDQFLFINNRPIKDKILNIALKVAYQDYLERNRHAICVLFLKVNPQFVDVNVHPAKTEVRFHDPNIIRSLVVGAIKAALFSSSDKVSTKASSDALSLMQPIASSFQESPTISRDAEAFAMPGAQTKQNLQSYSSSRGSAVGLQRRINQPPRLDYSLAKSQELINTAPNVENHTVSEHNSFELESEYRLGAAKAQFHSTYIISQTKDSIIITDQHAAHERIGYEKIKEQIAKNGLTRQRLLIPEIVEMPDEYRAQLLDEYKDTLAKFGMIVEKFGDKSIIISELPALIGDANPKQLALDLGDNIQEMGENIVLTELIENITETYACYYAVRAGKKLSAIEMNELLRQMENTPFSGQCNHGRQTYIELKLKDIEKLFGRR